MVSTSEVSDKDFEFVFCTRCSRRVSTPFEFCIGCGAPPKKHPRHDQRKRNSALR